MQKLIQKWLLVRLNKDFLEVTQLEFYRTNIGKILIT